jgi:hypothetical protein
MGSPYLVLEDDLIMVTLPYAAHASNKKKNEHYKTT